MSVLDGRSQLIRKRQLQEKYSDSSCCVAERKHMRWPTNSRLLLDAASEQVAITAGLLLTDSDLFKILEAGPMADVCELLQQPDSEWFLVRPELLQDIVRVLRAGVGNLPDASPGYESGDKYLEEARREGDVSRILDSFNSVMADWKGKELDAEFAQRVAEDCGEALTAVCDVMLAIGEQLDRDTFRSPSVADWDGVQPLSDLYLGEAIPGDDNVFLDQKFIDFLAANEANLDAIHWRNFERLTAEFFQREEYDVLLGPGSKDGGVDVRVWPFGQQSKGPPLMLIQCKRHKTGSLVKLEYVKALWTDVVFEEAQKGLIATTSRVSPEGKKIAQARGYNLSFAESETVKEWVQSMWRYSWEGSTNSLSIGTYWHPPVLPLPAPPPWHRTQESGASPETEEE